MTGQQTENAINDKNFDIEKTSDIEEASNVRRSSSVIVRPAVPDDAKRLVEIYAPYVEDTAITFEYEVPSIQAFAHRISNTLERYPYLVAEQSGQIVGYAYVGPFHDRPAYDWSVETSIYVDRNIRHMGVGGILHKALEDELKGRGFLNMNACIAYIERADEHLDDNSVCFHEHLGYRMVGQFHKCGYKFGRWYDMVWMEKIIGEHGADPERPF